MRRPVSSKVQGYTVEISDLYRMGWNPQLGQDDFTHEPVGHFKPQVEQVKALREGTFAPDVAAEIKKLSRADLLVFSFPMWWFSLPAILKGWVDRVFAMGTAYGGAVGRFETGGFVGKRAILLFTTGSMEDMFGAEARDGDLEVLLFHIHHGMFFLVGFDVLGPRGELRPGPQDPRGTGSTAGERTNGVFHACHAARAVWARGGPACLSEDPAVIQPDQKSRPIDVRGRRCVIPSPPLCLPLLPGRSWTWALT